MKRFIRNGANALTVRLKDHRKRAAKGRHKKIVF